MTKHNASFLGGAHRSLCPPRRGALLLTKGLLTAYDSPVQVPVPQTPEHRGKALSGLRVPWGH